MKTVVHLFLSGFIFLLMPVLSFSTLAAQTKSVSLTLQRIEFRDTLLTRTLSILSDKKQESFNSCDYYLDFFQTDKSTEEYYIKINRFNVDNKYTSSFTYYVIINDIVYFVPNTVPDGIHRLVYDNMYIFLPSKKKFTIDRWEEKEKLIIAIIWKTVHGYYVPIEITNE